MIPVFEPEIGEAEIKAVTQAIKKGEISGSFGENIPAFEAEFAAFVGTKYAVAVTSGTTALHLAVAALNLKPGSEILLSASTNIATALAAAHNNCITVPVDSEPETWNLDLSKIEALITPKTWAIIPVHLYGHPVDMEQLMKIARKHNLFVIEDCAESHGATVRGKMTGSFGDMGCFSFYANKIITTGEGGMITTNNKKLYDQLCLLRNLGFTKPRFHHEVAAYNARMTGFQAAMGRVQLSKIDDIIERKRQIATWYNQHLADIPGLKLPVELPWAKNVYWMYAVEVLPGFGLTRDQLMAELYSEGVDSRTFFCSMSEQPALEERGLLKTACPVAERIWRTGLYLPSSHSLKEKDIMTIAGKVKKIRSKRISP